MGLAYWLVPIGGEEDSSSNWRWAAERRRFTSLRIHCLLGRNPVEEAVVNKRCQKYRAGGSVSYAE